MASFRSIAGYGLLAASLAARAGLAPRVVSVDERLDMLPRRGLPLSQPVSVRWNDRLVPVIAAADDRDAAVALGLVHGHLRLGQLEIVRRIARGRLAEAIGPAAVDLDRAVRRLVRADAAGEAGLGTAARRWLDGYVAGLNHAAAQAAELPIELDLLDLRPEPWRVADVLRLSRLVALDLGWAPQAELPAALLSGCVRYGGNAVAVSGGRSAGGTPMIAGDAHHAIGLPNPWLIVGLRAPGINAVGLTMPGVPAVTMGRNPWIAWAGSGRRATAEEGGGARRRESIPVRWWPPVAVTVHEGAAPAGDGFSALWQVNRARSPAAAETAGLGAPALVVDAAAGPDGGLAVACSDAGSALPQRAAQAPPLALADLAALQQDVRDPAALKMRDLLLVLAERNDFFGAESLRGRVWEELRAWDGSYAVDSTGALAFELLLHNFLRALHGGALPRDLWRLLQADVAALPPERLAHALAAAMDKTADGLWRHSDWGSVHRLHLDHVLAAAPVVGGRFRFADLSSPGGNGTAMKAAHGCAGDTHAVLVGAVARHVSDLGDIDANWFCLLGGQDGWIGAAAFIDQLPLWRRGEYLQVPMRPETVAALYAHETELTP